MKKSDLAARHDAIAAYATRMAGTDLDLDVELESAAIEQLLALDAQDADDLLA